MERKNKNKVVKVSNLAPFDLGLKPVKSRKVYGIDDIVNIPNCNGAGECCCGVKLMVEPSDVWRIMNNKRACEKLGIKTTMDLYNEDPEKAILAYSVTGPDADPMCVAVLKEKAHGLYKVCPFLEKKDEGYECILGADKLTTCKTTPIGRTIVRETGEWGYVVTDAFCKECPKSQERIDVRIEHWLKEHGMEDRYRQTEMWNGCIMWIKTKAKDELYKRLAVLVGYDWQRVPAEGANMSVEESVKHMPGSPEELLQSIGRTVELAMEESRKQEKTDEDTSEGNTKN